MCRFTGQLLLRGGGCHVAFGWYNAVGSGIPPAPNEIYELVPAKLPMCPDPLPATNAPACCNDTEFCPLAVYDTTQAPQHMWNNPTFTSDVIMNSGGRYKGGAIGFAMIGGEQCSQTKYSQAELNTKSTMGQPWVTVLIYQSIGDPQAYYIAFEDQPTCTTSWKGCNSQNDGDFNDFVYFITGVNCEGGGLICQTGMPGVCASGVTQCKNGDQINCKPAVAPSPEKCDGLDNDCNGMVDDGDNLCTGNAICDKGTCIHPCDDGEFACGVGYVCTNGYCREQTCMGKTCAADQICVHGQCQGGCDGVMCPHGTVCQSGFCVDLCAGVDCSKDGLVCENGACLPDCSCRACPTGKTCSMVGDKKCVDSGCENKTCSGGQVCANGNCVDPCDGATCPAGQECVSGACHPMMLAAGTGGATVIVTRDAGFGSGGAGTVGGSGSGGSGGPGNGKDAGPGATGMGDSVKTCQCETASGPGGAAWATGLIVALALRLRSRRRRRG